MPTAQTAKKYISMALYIKPLYFLMYELMAFVFLNITKLIVINTANITAIKRLFIAANSPSTQTIKSNTGGLFI